MNINDSRRTTLALVAGLAMTAQTALGNPANASNAPRSRQLADALLVAQHAETPVAIETSYDFTVTRPLTCVPGAAPDDPAYRCRMIFTEAGIAGADSITFMLYDRNVDFERSIAALEASLSKNPGILELQFGTHIKTTKPAASGGGTTEAPGDCRQQLGPHNSPAICTFLPDPQVLVIAVVSPKTPSYARGDSVGGRGEDDNDRAFKLANAALMMLEAALPSEQPRASAKPTAEEQAMERFRRRIAEITGLVPSGDAKR